MRNNYFIPQRTHLFHTAPNRRIKLPIVATISLVGLDFRTDLSRVLDAATISLFRIQAVPNGPRLRIVTLINFAGRGE